MQMRKLFAEFLGTAVLVFFAVGIATLAFGFQLFAASPAAGIVMTALGFGLVLSALVYALGPISGCHVNPAVTLGFVLAQRMTLKEAAGYWAAQVLGGIVGAVALWAVFHGASGYGVATVGLGTNGWGAQSMIGLGMWGAFAAEAILTALFVLIVLATTSHVATAGFAGIAIGMGLALVHLLGIPLTGTSVNPARSLGPALVVGGGALRQVWLFVVAPLIGGAIAAVAARALFGASRAVETEREEIEEIEREEVVIAFH
ncbi:MAG: aquaporin [Acidobacteriota bacterium]